MAQANFKIDMEVMHKIVVPNEFVFIIVEWKIGKMNKKTMWAIGTPDYFKMGEISGLT